MDRQVQHERLARRRYRVAVHGLPHFCRKLSALVDGGDWHVPYRSPFHPVGWGARLADLARCDLAYSWTGRINPGLFLRAARALDKRKVILLWSGSDVLFASEELGAGKKDPWVTSRVHWAVSPWMAEEVRALGVECEYVQTSFVSPVAPSPLPAEFSVLAYAPSLKKAELYGVDRILQAAAMLPSIPFRLVGLQERSIPEAPANLQVFGRVNLDEFYRTASVLLRPVRHDGLSFMVLESLAHGRHVLYSYPLPGCRQVTTVQATIREIERLRDLHSSKALQLNHEGLETIARDYHRDVVRARLLERWEQMILAPEMRPGARHAVAN
jgi:hypothetical protein